MDQEMVPALSTTNLLGDNPFREKLRMKEKALEIARGLAQEPKPFQVGVIRELELLFLDPYPESGGQR